MGTEAMRKDLSLEHAMNLVGESKRNTHTITVVTRSDVGNTNKEETFDIFDDKIIGDIWGFVKKYLYEHDGDVMIFVNGDIVYQFGFSDTECRFEQTKPYMISLRNNVWYKINNSSRYNSYGLDGEPQLLHIIKGGHQNPTMYFVVHESAFDPIGYETELLTSLQIEEKYGIKL